MPFSRTIQIGKRLAPLSDAFVAAILSLFFLSAAFAFETYRFAQTEPAAPSSPSASPPDPAKTGSAQNQETSPASAGTPAVVMDGQQVESILGKKIRSNSDEDMGRIVDVIVDKSGQIRAAIIDFGGFLGVGSRQIAVDWMTIRFLSGQKSASLTVDLTRDQLRVAPIYKAGEQIVVLGRPRVEQGTTPPQASAGNPATDTKNTSPPQR